TIHFCSGWIVITRVSARKVGATMSPTAFSPATVITAPARPSTISRARGGPVRAWVAERPAEGVAGDAVPAGRWAAGPWLAVPDLGVSTMGGILLAWARPPPHASARGQEVGDAVNVRRTSKRCSPKDTTWPSRTRTRSPAAHGSNAPEDVAIAEPLVEPRSIT